MDWCGDLDPALVAGTAGGMALHRPGQADPEPQNAFVESFNGRLWDECLNETLFTSMAQARAVLAAWRHDYNTVRPHSKLGGLTPAEIAVASPQPSAINAEDSPSDWRHRLPIASCIAEPSWLRSWPAPRLDARGQRRAVQTGFSLGGARAFRRISTSMVLRQQAHEVADAALQLAQPPAATTSSRGPAAFTHAPLPSEKAGSARRRVGGHGRKRHAGCMVFSTSRGLWSACSGVGSRRAVGHGY